ncbi:MAG: V4R domain-containing protein [Acidobacteriaceae bacterium]
MTSIPSSGYYYPNRLALTAFKALVEVMGKNGFNAMLNLAHLGKYIQNYPADDMERGFDFADFSAIQSALEEMYGFEGSQLFIKRAGKATFEQSLRQYGALAGVVNPAFRNLPLVAQIRIGIQALARIMTHVSDQMISVEESETEIRYRVTRCPHCWGRSNEARPMCTFETGLLEESLAYFSGGLKFTVQETHCLSMGQAACVYAIQKPRLNPDPSSQA